MAQKGKFLEKKFKNQQIMFTMDQTTEWIEYDDATAINSTVICAIYIDYDEDCGIITFQGTIDKIEFYIPEDSITMFWTSEQFRFLENTKTILNTGKKFLKVDRDIM